MGRVRRGRVKIYAMCTVNGISIHMPPFIAVIAVNLIIKYAIV